MGLRHMAGSAFKMSLLTNSVKDPNQNLVSEHACLFFRKLNLGSVIQNRFSEMNYLLQWQRRASTQEVLGPKPDGIRGQKVEEPSPMVMTAWRTPKGGILTTWRTPKGRIFTELSGKPFLSAISEKVNSHAHRPSPLNILPFFLQQTCF